MKYNPKVNEEVMSDQSEKKNCLCSNEARFITSTSMKNLLKTNLLEKVM